MWILLSDYANTFVELKQIACIGSTDNLVWHSKNEILDAIKEKLVHEAGHVT